MEKEIEKIAKVVHAVNQVYRQSIGETPDASWETAPDWMKASTRLGVQKILTKEIRTAKDSHESWLAHYRSNGWTHGPVKDPEKKEHPCFLPYEELPIQQRVKDDLFWAVVVNMGQALGVYTEGE